ncbi:MAG TPA: asparaginase [Polyangium sp.]|nr:asparaginase [Polyangium sp.]
MRLLLIHTGGTLMMRGGHPTPLAPDVYTRDLVAELPVLRKLAEIETRILYNLDSADFQPHHWIELARLIHGSLDRYDGFVIVHGTDTMAYTASALAFLLPGLDRPVVLTGAQKPLVDIRTDARTNLVDACHLATMGIAEVGIAFHSELLRGCRSTKLDAWGMKAFGSPACPPLAVLGLGANIAAHALAPRPAVPLDERIETQVLVVRTFPGLDPRFLQTTLRAGLRGLVLEAFGAGNVPRIENSLVPVIEEARALDVPVVIVSQSPRGAVDLTRYQGGVAAANAGAIGAGDMTSEATLTKLMLALGRCSETNTKRVDHVRAAFAVSWAGEMSLE